MQLTESKQTFLNFGEIYYFRFQPHFVRADKYPQCMSLHTRIYTYAVDECV